MESQCARYAEEECVAAMNGLMDARCEWKAQRHSRDATVLNVRDDVQAVVNIKLDALEIVLGAAGLITTAFAVMQLQQWWKTRQYNKQQELNFDDDDDMDLMV